VTGSVTDADRVTGSGSLERKSKSHRGLIEYAMRHAQKLGVELMLETRVTGATPNEVVLSNGEHIPTRTIICTVGTKPSHLLSALPLPFDERGRVRVDTAMHVEGREAGRAETCAVLPRRAERALQPPRRQAGRYLAQHRPRRRREESKRSAVPSWQGIRLAPPGVAEAVGFGARRCVARLPRRRSRSSFLTGGCGCSRTGCSPLVGRDIVRWAGAAGAYDVRHHVPAGRDDRRGDLPLRHVHAVVEGQGK
jgi:hypothetical protein